MSPLEKVRELVRKLPPNEKLALMRELADQIRIANPALLEKIKRSDEDIRSGRVYTLEQVSAMADHGE